MCHRARVGSAIEFNPELDVSDRFDKMHLLRFDDGVFTCFEKLAPVRFTRKVVFEAPVDYAQFAPDPGFQIMFRGEFFGNRLFAEEG